MFFVQPKVVIEAEDKLERRVMKFILIEGVLKLDYDCDEMRPTRRHKYRPVQWWDRLNWRGCTMERRRVPTWAVNEALQQVIEEIADRTWAHLKRLEKQSMKIG